MTRRLDRLIAIADLRRERQVEELGRIEREATRLAREMDTLRSTRVAAGTLLDLRGPAAERIGLWEEWQHARLIELGRDAAVLAARKEAARGNLARSVVQCAVLRKVQRAAGAR
jgi:hypothetical protein